jgi:hypothetical protein
MSDFLQFMKFATNPEATKGLGEQVTGFGDAVIKLLTEIRDNTALIAAQQSRLLSVEKEEPENGR